MDLSPDRTVTSHGVVSHVAYTGIASEKLDLANDTIKSLGDSDKNLQNGYNNYTENSKLDVVSESRMIRKLDSRMIPLLFLMCEYIRRTIDPRETICLPPLDLMSYLDRSNIG